MKLSKCKQALADLIYANGGWVDVADCATQDKDGWVCSYEGKPTRCGDSWKDNGDCLYKYGFDSGEKIQNWHQCVLSREEYYQAYPKADAYGWIEWKGVAKSPVGKGVAVDVKMKNGTQHFGQPIDDECWGDHWGDAGIAAYRLHKTDVKPALCESVTRGIPEPESIDGLCAKVTEENKHQHVDAKPTIEQLAQDYRNAKDHADRLQKEADDAAKEADVKFGDLELLMESLGFSVIYVGYKQKNELLITDWRDLKVGDEIRCIGDWQDEETHGLIFKVDRVEESSYKYDLAVRVVLDDGSGAWGKDFEFIRRP